MKTAALLSLALLAAPARADLPPTTAPAAATTKSEFPDWALKAYPDDITRLTRFDRIKEAQTLGEKQLVALAIDPDKTPELIQTIASVCHLYLAVNRTADAQTLLNKGLALAATKIPGKEKELDIAHAQLEEVQCTLAINLGERERAAEFAKSALDRLKKNLPADALPIIDQTIEVEDIKVHAAGNAPVREAPGIYQHAIAVYTKTLGTADCAPVADTYMSSGYYNLSLNPARAEADFNTAFAIRKKIYGENSEVGSSLEALALISTLRGNDDLAMKQLQQARDMTIKIIGEDDPEIAGIDLSMAAILERGKKPDEAEKKLLKIVTVLAKYPESRPQLAEALDILAEHYHAAGKDDKADESHDRAEKIKAELRKRQEL